MVRQGGNPNIRVQFEDERLLVVEKPVGLSVHGGSNVRTSLLDQLSASGQTYHLVHRLDREVGGLMLLAKDSRTASYLGRRMGEIQRSYSLVVLGRLRSRNTPCHEPLRSSSGGRLEKATTHFESVKNFSTYSLLRARLVTGRKHQIRRHAKAIGHPIVGDRKYGDFEANRQLRRTYSGKLELYLFAHQLRIPFYKNGLGWRVDLPSSFKAFANAHGLRLG